MEIEYSHQAPDMFALYNLYQTTGWYLEKPISQSEIARAVDNSQFKVSAYSEGPRLVGFGRVLTDGVIHAMIYEMIVEPRYQRRGIGKTILKMLVDYCLELKVRDIQLFCARDRRGFYEKSGFAARPDDAPGMQYTGLH